MGNHPLSDRASADPFSAAYGNFRSLPTQTESAFGRVVRTGGPAVGLSRMAQQIFGPAGMGGASYSSSMSPMSDVTGSGPGMNGQRSGVQVSAPMYYDPRYATPDKLNFPRQESQANSIWRHLYHHDPIIGPCLDLLAEMPWSDYDLTGVDSGTPRRVFEDQASALNLPALMPLFSLEHQNIGKCIPHLVFDAAKGHWVGAFAHNPDYVDVYPTYVWGVDPIMDLRPTPEMRMLAFSPDPRMDAARQRIPEQMLQYIVAGIPIPLDPLNSTYIARKASPYATLGTSILTRLFGTQMLHDVLASATIAISQRNAAPLRVFKLGDAAGGYIPTKEDEAQLASILATLETDPFSALIFHSGLNVEYVGVSDKSLLLTREFDYIERVKLLAFGLSKSFLIGEQSYAASIAGLQVFIERMAAYRRMWEGRWIVPKLFKAIAEMNGFYKRVPARVHNRIIVSQERRELEIPTIQWHKRLQPQADPQTINIYKELARDGDMSKRTLLTSAGVDYDSEQIQMFEDALARRELESRPEYADLIREGRIPIPNMGGGPPGGPGPRGASRTASRDLRGPYRHRVESEVLQADVWDRRGYHHGVHFEDAEPIVELLREGRTDHPNWSWLSNRDMGWRDVSETLASAGWTDREIEAMRRVADAEGVASDREAIEAANLDRQMSDDRGVQNALGDAPPEWLRAGPTGRFLYTGAADPG